MSFSDISARFKKGRDEQAPAPAVIDFAESYRLRARMIGVLLRDARLHARRSVEECARLLRVDPALYESWEYGEASPSLPQLEIIAYFLDVPVSQFWSTNTLQDSAETEVNAGGEYQLLRDRMVGVLLRQARQDGGLSVEALAERTALTAEQIERYELGDEAVPMHVLSVLASGVNKNISYFLESSSHIGELLALRETWKQFTDMPEDVRRFVANPLNEGFIRIAMMFSQLPTEQLRKVGESFLEITL